MRSRYQQGIGFILPPGPYAVSQLAANRVTNPQEVAMSVERTREVMNTYFTSAHSDVSMMADDVVFTMMATRDETKTP